MDLHSVRNPDVVEEGRISYVPFPGGDPSTSRFARSPIFRGKGKIDLTSLPVPGKCFEVASPDTSRRKQSFVEDPRFSAALDTRLLGLVCGVDVTFKQPLFPILGGYKVRVDTNS